MRGHPVKMTRTIRAAAIVAASMAAFVEGAAAQQSLPTIEVGAARKTRVAAHAKPVSYTHLTLPTIYSV